MIKIRCILLIVLMLLVSSAALIRADEQGRRIAVIDTGSNIADESYTVLGGSTADDNGHGTDIVKNILANTDKAYIISIKALEHDGLGSVDKVCEALDLALSLDVDIILMPVSFRDNGSYGRFTDKVNDICSRGITVIASAGNNNADASLYLPSSIPDVITVGAMDDGGVKSAVSNYGNCVDYYITASSTSEACAVFAGRYINGDTASASASCIIPESAFEDYGYSHAESRAEFKKLKQGVYLFVTKEQMRAAGYTNSSDFRDAVIASCKKMNGAEYDKDHEYPDGGLGVGEPVDCITYANVAYANALGQIKDLKTRDDLVTFRGKCVDSGPWHFYTCTGSTGCTPWLYLRGIFSGTDPKTGIPTFGVPVGISLRSLNCKRGDLVFFGGWRDDGVFKWLHAAVYDGSGEYFWQARSKSMTTGKSLRPEVSVNASSFNSMVVLHIEDFDEFTLPDEEDHLSVRDYSSVKWYSKDGNKYCRDSKGNDITGLARISSKTYLFDDNGVMLTGWQYYHGHQVYLDNKGVMQKGWKKIGGSKYYFTKAGVMVTGAVRIKNDIYVFNSTGALSCGWVNVNGKLYRAEEDGKAITDTWITVGRYTYRLGSDGAVCTGWQNIDGYRYCFSDKGVMLADTVIDGFRLDADGHLV